MYFFPQPQIHKSSRIFKFGNPVNSVIEYYNCKTHNSRPNFFPYKKEKVQNKRKKTENQDCFGSLWLFYEPVGQQSSMSDSDLMKTGGPASRGPECRSPPTPRMELLSPSKVKDRSQNVTEKVTQVRGVREPHMGREPGSPI